jgi:ribose transport system substrate-binding protein
MSEYPTSSVAQRRSSNAGPGILGRSAGSCGIRWAISRAVGLGLLLFASTMGALQAGEALVIGLIARNRTDPTFLAAQAGARAAAVTLGQRYGVRIAVEFDAPVQDDAASQAAVLDQLSQRHVSGVALFCADPVVLVPPIARAVQSGIPVVTFGADAPGSARLANFCADDQTIGTQVMDALAFSLHGNGVVAVFAGQQKTASLKARVIALRAAAVRYPGITLAGVIANAETDQGIATAIVQTRSGRTDITGIAILGEWALHGQALPWSAGQVTCVALGSSPAALGYVASGQVQVVLQQPCYQWGYRAVEILVAKLVAHTDPSAQLQVNALLPVTSGNLASVTSAWNAWVAPQ